MIHLAKSDVGCRQERRARDRIGIRAEVGNNGPEASSKLPILRTAPFPTTFLASAFPLFSRPARRSWPPRKKVHQTATLLVIKR